jgi:hypothetical protein
LLRLAHAHTRLLASLQSHSTSSPPCSPTAVSRCSPSPRRRAGSPAAARRRGPVSSQSRAASCEQPVAPQGQCAAEFVRERVSAP